MNYQKKKVDALLDKNLKNTLENLHEIIPSVDFDDLSSALNLNEKEAILNLAEKALMREFEIFSTKVRFEDDIDWHQDFNSGFRWPKGILYSKYKQVDTGNNSDVKFPRELSRCHHFLYLGEAFLLTKDEKYTEEFILQVRSWIRNNPYKKSINWGCTMDTAIRASNWVFSLRMFLKSDRISQSFLKEIFSVLYLHGRIIYENPEKNRSYNHNHYLSDLSGQLLLGLLFKGPISIESKHWLENGLYEFYKEIRLQILPSGFSYERSINYHRLVLELISYTLIILKNNSIEIPRDISFRIREMFMVVMNYLFPDGNAPIIGDQDNGRYLPFFPYPTNYQAYLLNIGAVLFDNELFKGYFPESLIDVLFLFGTSGSKKLKNKGSKKVRMKSKNYSDAGFYILRSKKVYLFINNSGLSHYNEVIGGTHTHSDLLSFVYLYNGAPFLIDPGTYVYSSDSKERMKFRSTYMHNTITIDDQNQNELKEKELWFIKRDAIPRDIIWSTSSTIDIYEGGHSGYERFRNPIEHVRRFKLNKLQDKLIIIDKIFGEGNHLIKVHFHFDENVKVLIKEREFHCSNNGERIKIYFSFKDLFNLELKEEYVSKSYNQKERGCYAIVSFKFKKTTTFKTIIENLNDN